MQTRFPKLRRRLLAGALGVPLGFLGAFFLLAFGHAGSAQVLAIAVAITAIALPYPFIRTVYQASAPLKPAGFISTTISSLWQTSALFWVIMQPEIISLWERISNQQALLHPLLVTAAVAWTLHKMIHNFHLVTGFTDGEIFKFYNDKPAPKAPIIPHNKPAAEHW